MIINTKIKISLFVVISFFLFSSPALATGPVVVTGLPEGTTQTTTTLKGLLVSEGGESMSSAGFQYGYTVGYGLTAPSLVPQFEYIFDFGETGFGMQEGFFNQPTGIAVNNTTGKIYVIEQNGSSSRVQIFSTLGVFESQFGGIGSGDGQFDTTGGIAIDSEGTVYVTDVANNRIQAFDSSGNYLFQFGTFGFEPGQLYYPYGIDVDADGYIYITDTYNNRVQKFDGDGNYILSFGSQGLGDGQFTSPVSISVDTEGDIYVGDWSHRVQKFDSDGNHLLTFGTSGSGDGEFVAPLGIFADDYGSVFVADYGNSRVQIFNSDGEYISAFGVHNQNEALPGQFFNVGGLTVDISGDIYVSDIGHGRIQKFSRDFSANVTGLKCGKIYHFRALVNYVGGTSFGEDRVFNTKPCRYRPLLSANASLPSKPNVSPIIGPDLESSKGLKK